MIDALLAPVRRRTRQGAIALVCGLLGGAWLSIALFLGLAYWLPAWLAALSVTGVVVVIYAVMRWTPRRRPTRSAEPDPGPALDPETLVVLKTWVGDNPWLATGVAAGLGFASAQSGRDMAATMRQVTDLVAGLDAAMQQTAAAQTRPAD